MSDDVGKWRILRKIFECVEPKAKNDEWGNCAERKFTKVWKKKLMEERGFAGGGEEKIVRWEEKKKHSQNNRWGGKVVEKENWKVRKKKGKERILVRKNRKGKKWKWKRVRKR